MIFSFLKNGIWIFVLAVLFCSCESSASGSASEVSVLNWNLETFFDANFDGNEYSEFKNSKSGWSMEKYSARLKRLGDVLKKLDADIVVLEELEKKEQIYDIFNILSGGFDFAKSYKYGAFAASTDAPIGCAVISRFPLSDVRVHEIFSDSEGKMPSMRPIMQINVSIDGKNLCLFVNHWKSKSGGSEQSEVWRNAQEENLSRLMSVACAEGSSVLAAGDFNRDIGEFIHEKNGDFNVRLRGSDNLFVYSPWLERDFDERGSYWYKDRWERIDHFFSCGGAKIVSFEPQTNGEWADNEGKPRKYKVYNGYGYSDHLPIMCRVSF